MKGRLSREKCNSRSLRWRIYASFPLELHRFFIISFLRLVLFFDAYTFLSSLMRHTCRSFCLLSVCHVIDSLSLRHFQRHSSNLLNCNNSTFAEVRASGGSVDYIGRDVQLPTPLQYECSRVSLYAAFTIHSTITVLVSSTVWLMQVLWYSKCPATSCFIFVIRRLYDAITSIIYRHLDISRRNVNKMSHVVLPFLL